MKNHAKTRLSAPLKTLPAALLLAFAAPSVFAACLSSVYTDISTDTTVDDGPCTIDAGSYHRLSSGNLVIATSITGNVSGGLLYAPGDTAKTVTLNSGASIVNNSSDLPYSYAIRNVGTIAHITNNGTLNGAGGGIWNTGTLTTLTNRQSGLIYKGNAPVNYNIAIAGTGSGDYGTLLVKDTADWDISGLTFGIATDSTVAAGTTYQDVIQKSGTSTFNSSTTKTGVYSSGGTTYNFNLIWDNDNWDLVIASLNTFTFAGSAATLGNTPAGGAAQVLDANPAVNSSFSSLSTEQDYADAATQSMPLLTGGSIAATGSALTGINRVIQARMESSRGLSSGEAFAGDEHVWMKPFGSWADQDDRRGVAGYKSQTGGIAFGVDGTVSDHTRLGVSFAYASVNVDSNSTVAPNYADIAVYQLLGYGSHSLSADTELNFQAGIGQNKNSGRRDILLAGSSAEAKYDSLVATAGAGLARTYTLSEATSFIPSVRADYTWIKDKGYTETGAGALNLTVASRTADELILAADAKLAHDLGGGTTVTANAGLGYDALASQSSVTATFAGAPGAAFVTHGMKPEPWLARAGLGLAQKTQSGMEINARYDAEHRQGFLNQTASVKLRWAF